MTMANDAATRELRLSLADMLQSTDALRADVLRHDDTRLARIAMPFFRRAQVYRAFYDIGPIPVGFTVGHAEDWATVLLEENLEGWHTLAERWRGVGANSDAIYLAIGHANFAHRNPIARNHQPATSALGHGRRLPARHLSRCVRQWQIYRMDRAKNRARKQNAALGWASPGRQPPQSHFG